MPFPCLQRTVIRIHVSHRCSERFPLHASLQRKVSSSLREMSNRIRRGVINLSDHSIGFSRRCDRIGRVVQRGLYAGWVQKHWARDSECNVEPKVYGGDKRVVEIPHIEGALWVLAIGWASAFTCLFIEYLRKRRYMNAPRGEPFVFSLESVKVHFQLQVLIVCFRFFSTKKKHSSCRVVDS